MVNNMGFFKKNKVLTVVLIILSVFLYKYLTKEVKLNIYIDKKSNQYVNDIYMSKSRIYDNYLNEKEKKMYMYILDASKKRKVKNTFNLSDFNCMDYGECFGLISTSFEAILLDHPELMTFAGASWQYVNNQIILRMDYAVKFSFFDTIAEKRIRVIIDDIREKTKNMSDEDKIKYVYEWIGDNNTYDTIFTMSSKNQSIYNVFLKHNAVCAGFAKSSEVIFQNIGINSFLVTSKNHMWNIVEYNGKYYFFDSTVAASRKKNTPGYYDGLNQEFLNSYSINNSNWFTDIQIEKEKMFQID